ncbi:MAG TPA: bifunctional 4-hydroxy-2-oxoglutarate aldolase/2-dehydro-3-deoxy-phosphogluconate aldolase [Gemmatimonadaceae bacterium]|nr:bifunctional 4-hydroxy-2-oxoglutarate aldolase/2-dehydro-3-deoxy-phosphogluconate aldolase [Gemmatimonadaceae bacterium]
MIQAEFDSDIVARLRRVRVIPVITIDDAENAVPLARALLAGGLSCAEITFRTTAAAEALRRISAEVPDVLVGAGTVLTASQADAALDAGAQFIVAPGFGPHVVEFCQAHAVAVFPGVATPTEIEAALETGLRTLKFFPAESLGGLAYLKAVAAPYADVRFIPTGGINAANVASYLAFDRVVACGGSWMAPADWIAAKQFDRIRDEAKRAVDAAHGITPPVVV